MQLAFTDSICRNWTGAIFFFAAITALVENRNEYPFCRKCGLYINNYK